MQDTDPAPLPSPAASLADWIRLELIPGAGPVTVGRLLARFGTPRAVFEAAYPDLRLLVSDEIARAILAPIPESVLRDCAAVHAWRQHGGNTVLTLDHPAYPPLLRQLQLPPTLLYASGNTALLGGPALAIVGSRNATEQGKANALAFGTAVSRAGLTVVSGLALGIDAAAHEGGLRGPGATVAVIGTGIDRIYPRRNAALARRIADEGCILSEYALGMGALANNFPRRNRLISGLSCGVLVVEAAERSGSLITAATALEQGRDVFAIPGSIHSPLAKGCHKLIKAGARLVEGVDDLLGELKLAPLADLGGPAGQAELGELGEHLALLYALGQGPIDANTLAGLTDIDPAFLSGQLLTLELAGHVERLPGGLFQRVNR